MMIKPHTDVKMANFLVENRPKMNIDETRLFLTLVASVNKDDTDFSSLQIPVAEFAELWGVSMKNAYPNLKGALSGLMSKGLLRDESINPKTGRKRLKIAPYLVEATYEEGCAYATVRISDAFKPYLIALKNQYTSYVLQNVMSLTGVNAIRNYELLKQYQTLGQRTFTIPDYKEKLKLDGKYSLNADLRRYVLDPAIKEINENTDLKVSYEFIGRGQKAKLKFTIRKQQLRVREELPGQISVDELEQPPTRIPWYDDYENGTPDTEQYLSGAVGNEFSREQLHEIYVLIGDKVFPEHPEGRNGAMYAHLEQMYAKLKIKAAEQDVPYRYNYLRTIIENHWKAMEQEQPSKSKPSYDLDEYENHDIFAEAEK